MKRMFLFITVFFVLALRVIAQDEKEEKGPDSHRVKKENLFTGGSVTASFYTGGTILGANPIFGYRLANWADAGIALNYVYTGEKDEFNNKARQNVFGAGVFTRLYPLRFFFFQGQLEHNFINTKYIFNDGVKIKYKADANSLLVGAGLAQGRERGSNTFYYISLLFDVIRNVNSPYMDVTYNSLGQPVSVRAIPIVRAGINIGLFQGHNDNEERNNGRKRPRSYDRY